MSENTESQKPADQSLALVHTPGPWTAQRHTYGWAITPDSWGDRGSVCSVRDHRKSETDPASTDHYASLGSISDNSCGPPWWDEHEANARLIAKSPELKELAESFIREWEETWVDPDEVSHEWSGLYRRAKELIREINGGHSG